jgi:hypothetical protein
MKRSGELNEGIMEFLMTSVGFKDLRPQYKVPALLENADKVRNGRVTNVASKIKKFRGWDLVSPGFVIDRVYGIDYIAQVGDEKIGFDFTVNPESVEEKKSKANGLAPLWKSLGISKVVVLLTIYPDSEDQGLAFLDKAAAEEEILSAIYDASESTEEVSTAKVIFENNKD